VWLPCFSNAKSLSAVPDDEPSNPVPLRAFNVKNKSRWQTAVTLVKAQYTLGREETLRRALVVIDLLSTTNSLSGLLLTFTMELPESQGGGLYAQFRFNFQGPIRSDARSMVGPRRRQTLWKFRRPWFRVWEGKLRRLVVLERR
jgi:hypothetical protein